MHTFPKVKGAITMHATRRWVCILGMASYMFEIERFNTIIALIIVIKSNQWFLIPMRALSVLVDEASIPYLGFHS